MSDTLLGIREDNIIEKLYTATEPLGLHAIHQLWPAHTPDKLKGIAELLGILENKDLVISEQWGEVGSKRVQVWKLTEKGRSYYEENQERIERLKHEEQLQYIKLKNETLVSTWIRRTYWITMIAAIVGAVIGIVTLVIQLIDKFK